MSDETRAPDSAPSGAAGPVGEFPRPKPALLAEAIADSVAEAVATGHLAPGERIVETGLAEKYGVSRVPVREALKVLATQGILVGGGHRGYRVVSFAPEKIEQVFEVRLELETILLRDAVANWRARGGGLGALDTVIETMRTAARAGDLRGMLRADLEFHRAICRASENAIAAALWNAIARHVLIIFNLARYRDVDLERALNQHRKLRDWIRAEVDGPGKDGEEAGDFRSALEQHFQSRRPAHAPAEADGELQRPVSDRQSRNAAKVASSGG
ncbi:MAG: GntR family transcriptional regulator [Immundisolibacterales bacterium]|nr:GntR family transcriptional regulator [Immundisolibacterales bacterium]